MKICRMQGCGLAVMGYSIYCENHKRRNRRHGHPDQTSVTAYELEPLRKRVRTRIEKNTNNPSWQILQDRWEALKGIAKEHLEKYESGAVHNRYDREAWSNIAKLGSSVETMEIIVVVLAMYLMQEENSYRFKSDQAFAGQLVRRVRNLAPTNSAAYYDHKTGKTKKVYRDLKPKTMGILAKLLQETFGVAGVAVARLEQQEINKKREEQQALHTSLGELQ